MSIQDVWAAWFQANHANFVGGEILHQPNFINNVPSEYMCGPIVFLEMRPSVLQIETSFMATSPVDQEGNPTGQWRRLTHEGANQVAYALEEGAIGMPHEMPDGRVYFESFDGCNTLIPSTGAKFLP